MSQSCCVCYFFLLHISSFVWAACPLTLCHFLSHTFSGECIWSIICFLDYSNITARNAFNRVELRNKSVACSVCVCVVCVCCVLLFVLFVCLLPSVIVFVLFAFSFAFICLSSLSSLLVSFVRRSSCCCKSVSFTWGQEGIEPSTSPTRTENHTTRPLPR